MVVAVKQASTNCACIVVVDQSVVVSSLFQDSAQHRAFRVRFLPVRPWRWIFSHPFWKKPSTKLRAHRRCRSVTAVACSPFKDSAQHKTFRVRSQAYYPRPPLAVDALSPILGNCDHPSQLRSYDRNTIHERRTITFSGTRTCLSPPPIPDQTHRRTGYDLGARGARQNWPQGKENGVLAFVIFTRAPESDGK